MQENPSYLNFAGIGEIEPHYFRPIVPEAIQSYVTNTPLDRGDGIRPVMLPQSSARMVNKLGATCIPCKFLTNPIAYGSYGSYGDWKSKLAEFASTVLTPEQKENLKVGFLSEASAKACSSDKVPQFLKGALCPTIEIDESGNASLQSSTLMYALAGVTAVSLISLVVILARK